MCRERSEKFSCGFPEAIDGAFISFAQEFFKLGEDLLDWVEVGRIGWQEQEVRARLFDHAPCRLALMAVKIVHDDDVPWFEGGDEDLLNIGFKTLPVDRPVKDKRRCEAVTAQGRDKGQGFPVAMRQLDGKALSLPAPAPQAGHIGLDPSLIDEHQAVDVDPALVFPPPEAPPRDVRPFLLAWKNAFF